MGDCKHRILSEGQMYVGFCEDCDDSELDIARAELKAAHKRIAELEAENAKLREALNPKDSLLWMDIAKQLEAENAKLMGWYRAAIIDVGELVVEAKVSKDLEGRYVAAQYRQTTEIAELKAANKQLLGDLEIANLRLVAAWKGLDIRGKRLAKLKDGIHDELWWQLLDEEPPE